MSVAHCLWMFILISLIGSVRLFYNAFHMNYNIRFRVLLLLFENSLVALWDKYYPVYLIFRTERRTFRSLADLALVHSCQTTLSQDEALFLPCLILFLSVSISLSRSVSLYILHFGT